MPRPEHDAFKNAKKGLTAEQVEEIRDVFKLIDEDGSGKVDVLELQVAYTMILGKDLTKAEAEAEISKFDNDGNMEIDFPEFLMLMKPHAMGINMAEHAEDTFFKFADYAKGRKRPMNQSMEVNEVTLQDLHMSWQGLKRWSEDLKMNCQDEELQEIMHYLARSDDDEDEGNPTITDEHGESGMINFERFHKILEIMGIVN